jgi:hypothetical protein
MRDIASAELTDRLWLTRRDRRRAWRSAARSTLSPGGCRSFAPHSGTASAAATSPHSGAASDGNVATNHAIGIVNGSFGLGYGA